MGIALFILSIAIYILLIWAVGNFGKNTAIGSLNSMALALVLTPIFAFLIILIFFKREKTKLTKMYRHFPKTIDN